MCVLALALLRRAAEGSSAQLAPAQADGTIWSALRAASGGKAWAEQPPWKSRALAAADWQRPLLQA